MIRYNIILLFLSLYSCQTFSQGKAAREYLARISGQYEINTDGNIVFQEIIDALGVSKEQIYVRAQNYIATQYNDANSVIQYEDKDQGTIIGKGLYPRVHLMLGSDFDAYHIIRVDVKEERARVTITLTEYKENLGSSAATLGVDHYLHPVNEVYPTNMKSFKKTAFTKCLVESYERSLKIIDGLRSALNEGGATLSDEW